VDLPRAAAVWLTAHPRSLLWYTLNMMPTSNLGGSQDEPVADMYIRQVCSRLRWLPQRWDEMAPRMHTLHGDPCMLQGEALISVGKWQDGLRTFQSGLSACGTHDRSQLMRTLAAPGSPLTADLLAQVSVCPPLLSKACSHMHMIEMTRTMHSLHCVQCAHQAGVQSLRVCMQCWTAVIRDAEAPILLSARDGKLLKPVSPEHRLCADALLQTLREQFGSAPWRLQLARRLLLAGAWARRRGAQRAAAAIMRGHVYCQRGALDVAMRVRCACSCMFPALVSVARRTSGVYCGNLQRVLDRCTLQRCERRLSRLYVSSDLQDARLALAYGPQHDGRCAWAPAHALLSTVLEAMVENTQVGCRVLDDRWPQRAVVQAYCHAACLCNKVGSQATCCAAAGGVGDAAGAGPRAGGAPSGCPIASHAPDPGSTRRRTPGSCRM
jgi:hypothetical protein